MKGERSQRVSNIRQVPLRKGHCLTIRGLGKRLMGLCHLNTCHLGMGVPGHHFTTRGPGSGLRVQQQSTRGPGLGLGDRQLTTRGSRMELMGV